MNIDAFKAGRELDALVAERVMGWTWDRPKSEGGVLGPCEGDPRFNWCAEWDKDGLPDWLPKYSTNHDAALDVFAKMLSHPSCYEFTQRLELPDRFAFVDLSTLLVGISPEAICLAALKAVGVE